MVKMKSIKRINWNKILNFTKKTEKNKKKIICWRQWSVCARFGIGRGSKWIPMCIKFNVQYVKRRMNVCMCVCLCFIHEWMTVCVCLCAYWHYMSKTFQQGSEWIIHRYVRHKRENKIKCGPNCSLFAACNAATNSYVWKPKLIWAKHTRCIYI